MKITTSRHATFNTILTFAFRKSPQTIPDFEANLCDVTVRYEGARTRIICGLGDVEKTGPHSVRSAAAAGIRRSIAIKRSRISVEFPPLPGIAADDRWKCALEGMLLGLYSFSKYKTPKPPPPPAVELVAVPATPRRIKAVTAVCDGVNYARDLVNENAHVMTPARLASEARTLGRKGLLRVTVFNETQLRQKGLHLLLAVGKGSPDQPRLMVIDYRGAPRSKKKTAIVGKGITFDSGGKNLKPGGHIETMRMDMAGAAAVLGTFQAIAALKPKINAVGIVAAAHNAIDGSSYFPGDVYRSFAGKSVEVCNTDAEGRLALADAIAWCEKTCKPTVCIDLATLTGGILTAFADRIAGVFANDDGLARALFEAGERTRERLWRMPLYDEYIDSMKSDIADLRNLSKFKRGYASSITGAAFISHFVTKMAWAHLDIAGVAWNEEKPRGEIPQFGTGFGVRLLMEYLMRDGKPGSHS